MRRTIKCCLLLVLTTTSALAQSSYFARIRGKLIFSDQSVQSFTGFRCSYSNRLYYSKNVDSLRKDNYTDAAAINLGQVIRIDFGERPNVAVRRGTATFRDGRALTGVYLYVAECSWADGDNVEGKLSDPRIVALSFDAPVKHQSGGAQSHG